MLIEIVFFFRKHGSARSGNVARNATRIARLHCNFLILGFTFFYAQGTDLRTGTVAVSCKYILGIFFLEESTEKTQ